MNKCPGSDLSEAGPAAWIRILLIFGAGLIVPISLMAIPSYVMARRSWSYDVQYLIHPLFRMSLVLVGVWCLGRFRRPRDGKPLLGLCVGVNQVAKGLLIGTACSLPMLIVGLMGGVRDDLMVRYLAYTTVMPGLTEEVFYRAFAFGLLVRVAGWRMWPAAVFTGVMFGLAHIDFTPDEGETILGQLGWWIAMIGLGGVLYAWLYERSGWNLWVVIALHIGMNLWWDVFDQSNSAMGSFGATGARIAAVGLALLLVVRFRLLNPDLQNQDSAPSGDTINS